jgi:hypothetical protein
MALLMVTSPTPKQTNKARAAQEEAAETARVVGYRPGLGSAIEREE